MPERVVSTIRARVPGAAVMLAKGSAASASRSAWSDIDVDVLVDDGEEAWPWWFETTGDGRLVHISVAVGAMDAWESALGEPQAWALGFAVAAPCRLLWARDGALHQRFDREVVRYPSGPPELEDMIESLGKARSGAAARDQWRFWPAIQDIGTYAPSVVIPLNPPVAVATRREALAAALALPCVPDRWQASLLTCLGVEHRSSDMDASLAAATTLVCGIVDMLRQRPEADLCQHFGPSEVDAILHGTLARYLRQGDGYRPAGR